MPDRPAPTFQAMVCGGGSILNEQFNLPTSDAARQWVKAQLATNSNLEYGCFRIRLDDASWTRITR